MIIASNKPLETIKKIFLAINATMAITYEGMPAIIKTIFVASLLLSFVNFDLINRTKFWGITLLTHIYYLQGQYFEAANHNFFLTYIASIFFLCSFVSDEEDFVKKQFKFLLLTLMLLATYHKLSSEFYRSGGLIFDYIVRGRMLAFVFSNLVPNYNEIIANNSLMMTNFYYQTDPFSTAMSINPIVPNLKFISQMLAFSVIALEGALVAIYLHPRWQIAKDWALLLFVIGTFGFRMENIFLATVSLTGLTLAKDENAKSCYILLAIYLLTLSLLDLMPASYM